MKILVFYTMNETFDCIFYPIEDNKIKKELEKYAILNPDIKNLEYAIFEDKNLPDIKFKKYTKGTKEKGVWVDTDRYLVDLKESKIIELKKLTKTKILEKYPLEKQSSILNLICYSEEEKKEMLEYITNAIKIYRTKKEKVLNAKNLSELESIIT